MNYLFFIIIIIIIIILIIFIYFYKKYYFIESFYNEVTTWTPYVMDCDNQPCYSNYFYKNGYMYPIY